MELDLSLGRPSTGAMRAVSRLLRLKAINALRRVRLKLRRPQWQRWNCHAGKVVSGFEAHSRLGLSSPVDIHAAASKMGVDVAFHRECCGWVAVIDSHRDGAAKLYIDSEAAVEDQRYVIALGLGYLIHTVPGTVVRLRLDKYGRARREDTIDMAGRFALVFALQLMLPRDIHRRRRFGSHWVAQHAGVPTWFAEQALNGVGDEN